MPLTKGKALRIIPSTMKKSQKWADVARWLGYVRRSRRDLVAAFLCLAVVMAADVVTPKIFGSIIDSVISPQALSAGAVRLPVLGLLPAATALLCILGFLLSIIALRGFAQFGTSAILGEVGEHVHLDIRQELFDHLQKLPLSWYDVSFTGKIMARLTTDTDALWALLSNGVRSVIGPALTIILVVIILFTISVPLTLVALVTAPLSGLLYRTARLRVTEATRNQRETLSSLYARLQERISGVRTIRIFAREKEESRLFGADIRASTPKTSHSSGAGRALRDACLVDHRRGECLHPLHRRNRRGARRLQHRQSRLLQPREVSSGSIFVLSDGRIVQQGRHAELLAVPGIYHELCTRQFLLGGMRR